MKGSSLAPPWHPSCVDQHPGTLAPLHLGRLVNQHPPELSLNYIVLLSDKFSSTVLRLFWNCSLCRESSDWRLVDPGANLQGSLLPDLKKNGLGTWLFLPTHFGQPANLAVSQVFTLATFYCPANPLSLSQDLLLVSEHSFASLGVHCADVAPHSFPSTACRVSYTAVRSVYCTPYSQFGLYHHFGNPFSSFRSLNRSQTQFVWLQIFLVTHARTHIYMDVRIYRSGAEV